MQPAVSFEGRNRWKGAVWWLLLLLAVTQFCLAYFQDDRPFLNLDLYLQGRYTMPYQGRILMAWVIQGAARVPDLFPFLAHLQLTDNLRDPRLAVVFVTSWFSLIGAVWLTRQSLQLLTGNQVYSRWAALLVLYMGYFHFQLAFGWNWILPYDMPSLFFFSGCLYCILSRRMLLYYVFFLLGVFNRETICMATLFFAVLSYYRERAAGGPVRRLSIAAHVGFQAAFWLAVRLYLHHQFRFNPVEAGSEQLLYKLPQNLGFLMNPKHWPILASVFGFTLPFYLFQRRWMAHRGMEQCVWILPVWFAGMMYVGVMVEIRIFAELISYMALAVALIVYNRWAAAIFTAGMGRTPCSPWADAQEAPAAGASAYSTQSVSTADPESGFELRSRWGAPARHEIPVPWRGRRGR
jgi:hypothetical protein